MSSSVQETILDGRYRLGTRLGVGGMAEVYRAEVIGEAGFSKPVAIKRVLRTLSDGNNFAEMFVHEARVVSLLSHPNIVNVVDFARDDNKELFLVMELVEGCDLMRLMKSGPMPINLTGYVIGQILKGLNYAHNAKAPSGEPLGIVHRDVTPHNVLLSWSGAVKLSDFGIAKVVSISGGTGTQSIKGKLGYLSPEQATGARLDGRSDLFAVGVILYEMLTSRRLFGRGTYAEIVGRMMHQPIPAPSKLAPHVPELMDKVCLRLLERDRSSRFSAADEAFDALVATGHVSPHGERELADLLFSRAPLLTGSIPAAPISAPPREPTWAQATLQSPLAAIELSDLDAAPLDRSIPASGPGQSGTSNSNSFFRALKWDSRKRFGWLVLIAGCMAMFVIHVVQTIGFRNPKYPQAVPLRTTSNQPSSSPVAKSEKDLPPSSPPKAEKKDFTATSSSQQSTPPKPTPLKNTPRLNKRKPNSPPKPRSPLRKGRLVIGSNPWGHILIDNKRFGSTPRIVRLTEGLHTVTVENDEFGLKKQRRVRVVAGQEREVFFELQD